MDIMAGLLRGMSSEDMFFENLMTSKRENDGRVDSAQIVSADTAWFSLFAKITPENYAARFSVTMGRCLRPSRKST